MQKKKKRNNTKKSDDQILASYKTYAFSSPIILKYFSRVLLNLSKK
jgi:hypothetical protein